MRKRPNGAGAITAAGYVSIQKNRTFKYEHILLAEKAIGKKLPKGAQVHHIDENPANNRGSNLVVCPDQAYHFLLHRRADALNACGNPSFIICRHCRKYDDPANLIIDGSRSRSHRDCRNAYRRRIYLERGVA